MCSIKTLLAAVLAASLCLSARAQDLDLAGEVWWQKYTRNLLEIFAEEVINDRPAGLSGPLRLVIWATPNQPSNGDFTDAYEIGILNLGDLYAGEWFEDIHYYIRYISPPPGLYYTSISLDEYSSQFGWMVADWADFEDIVNFGGVGEGVAQSAGSNGDIYFDGEVAWESRNGRAILAFDRVVNERGSKSGPLRISLWATDTPYAGGVLEGYRLAWRSLGRLKNGYQYENYARYAAFRIPPEDFYYTTMVIEEKVFGQWTIVDWITFPEQSIF